MLDMSKAQMTQLAVHRVGNKQREEGIVIAPGLYDMTDGQVEQLLLKYFFSSFKEKVLYKFFHEADIHLHELYMYVSRIFINPAVFYEQSVHILKHLYEKSGHPQIKGGEFYVAYFSDCLVEGKTVDAVGLFKTENKENYLKVSQRSQGMSLLADRGINVKKLDKGALIFNTESVDGYRVAIVDTVNRENSEAAYWKDEFLRLTDVQNDYFHTQNHLNLCRDFAESVYGSLYQADKKDQVMFVNGAVAYFDQNQSFDLDDFTQAVVKEPELIERFKEHKVMYELNQGLATVASFAISDQAVKTTKRKLKNLIKLDTDIEIKIKPAAAEQDAGDYIERGYDEARGMHFYKVYFNEEE
ncbi:nucleoid-associated protein [Propionispora hippei]|uniref:Nucleoid associated protein NdpA n=1 Tax=Propionispora hippei DSM 15287 TaxID=1123003 RepID=A0A1M6IL10_9FIRM|nr:nucleoid-associated protein [Propionispora hippei]SHJ35176.1 hypothetical protein SAMN02745170_02337 [Propionispora hippei DSM 15287]